jgi:hypothetical protein
MGCVPRKQPFILAPPTVTVHAQTAPQRLRSRSKRTKTADK